MRHNFFFSKIPFGGVHNFIPYGKHFDVAVCTFDAVATDGTHQRKMLDFRCSFNSSICIYCKWRQNGWKTIFKSFRYSYNRRPSSHHLRLFITLQSRGIFRILYIIQTTYIYMNMRVYISITRIWM